VAHTYACVHVCMCGPASLPPWRVNAQEWRAKGNTAGRECVRNVRVQASVCVQAAP